jgi:hypothetical protein
MKCDSCRFQDNCRGKEYHGREDIEYCPVFKFKGVDNMWERNRLKVDNTLDANGNPTGGSVTGTG